jgi:hypothetical protein
MTLERDHRCRHPVFTAAAKSAMNCAMLTAGEWHRIEIEAMWKSDGTGHYKMWYDGEKVLEREWGL